MKLKPRGQYMFDNISGSVTVDSECRSFSIPSRDDYVEYLRKNEILLPDREIEDCPDLVEAVYRHWQQKPQLACVFGRMIAKNPSEFGVFTNVVAGTIKQTDVESVAFTTAKFVTAAIREKECEGLTVLLPGLLEVPVLTAFCREISHHAGWSLRALLNPSDRLDRVHVELKREISADADQTEILAEALGFGPFSFLPLTRRAPFTSIEIRTKPEGSGKSKGLLKKPTAHLADLPINMEQIAMEQAWRRSEGARLDVLGGDDSAAKARVTFAIPYEAWRSEIQKRAG